VKKLQPGVVFELKNCNTVIRKQYMSGKLKVTLVKSMIGRPEKHRRVLSGMGLRKMNKTVQLEDTHAIRGMINVVSHLVRVEEIGNET
jgi:large subunit ribosomal protein L30